MLINPNIRAVTTIYEPDNDKIKVKRHVFKTLDKTIKPEDLVNYVVIFLRIRTIAHQTKVNRMQIPARGFLAGVLAAAAVTGSFAQDAKYAAPTFNGSAATVTMGTPITYRAMKESEKPENKNIVIIAVMKGAKDEINPKTKQPMSADEIGQRLQEILLKKGAHIPGAAEMQTKVMTSQYSGDYSAVAYFFRGHAYGIYDLEKAVSYAWHVAGDYDDATMVDRLPKPSPGGQD